MARTAAAIQGEIAQGLTDRGYALSTSKVAEWRLWAYVVAAAIHAFEVILDLFRKEVDDLTNKITPGTSRWYAEMCYRFQNGHELLFDEKTAMLYYGVDAPASRIISVVAITEGSSKLEVKVAKLDGSGKIVPLSEDEKYNFTGYIDAVKFAGLQTEVVSTTADLIRYDAEIFFDPAVPVTTIRTEVEAAVAKFKTSLGFDSVFYRQRFAEAIMGVSGVVTVDLKAISRKGVSDVAFVPVAVFSTLESGYYDYDPGSVLTFTSTKNMGR